VQAAIARWAARATSAARIGWEAQRGVIGRGESAPVCEHRPQRVDDRYDSAVVVLDRAELALADLPLHEQPTTLEVHVTPQLSAMISPGRNPASTPTASIARYGRHRVSAEAALDTAARCPAFVAEKVPLADRDESARRAG